MAGICTGPGLGTDDSNHLIVKGARPIVWPHESTCRIADHNGIRYDPVTNDLWVPPDVTLDSESATKADYTFVPHGVGDVQMGTVELTLHAPACSRAMVLVSLSAGYLRQRMISGNWWGVHGFVRQKVNGTVVGFTGDIALAEFENTSADPTDVHTSAGPIMPWHGTLLLQPGDTYDVLASYAHDRIAYTASAVNTVTFRYPTIVATMIGFP